MEKKGLASPTKQARIFCRSWLANRQSERGNWLRATRDARPSPRKLNVLVDVIDRLTDGLNLLGILVGDGDVELFFEFHHQFDGIKRISP